MDRDWLPHSGGAGPLQGEPGVGKTAVHALGVDVVPPCDPLAPRDRLDQAGAHLRTPGASPFSLPGKPRSPPGSRAGCVRCPRGRLCSGGWLQPLPVSWRQSSSNRCLWCGRTNWQKPVGGGVWVRGHHMLQPPPGPLLGSRDNPASGWPPVSSGPTPWLQHPPGTLEQAVLLGVLGKEGAEVVHQSLEVVRALILLQGPREGGKAGPAQRLLHGHHEELGSVRLCACRQPLLLDTARNASDTLDPSDPSVPACGWQVAGVPLKAARRGCREATPLRTSTGGSEALGCPPAPLPAPTGSRTGHPGPVQLQQHSAQKTLLARRWAAHSKGHLSNPGAGGVRLHSRCALGPDMGLDGKRGRQAFWSAQLSPQHRQAPGPQPTS